MNQSGYDHVAHYDSRKKMFFTVEEKGRDAGKMYLLTEMPASRGEEWAIRAGTAALKHSEGIPSGIEANGMAALAQIGLRALVGVPWEILKPLMDEMMSCVQIVPDPQNTNVFRPLIESDIQEISTRIKLRKEVFKLHTDFSSADAA